MNYVRKKIKNLQNNSCRKFFTTGGLLSFRKADRSSLDTDVRAVDSGRDALLVQLLAGFGRDSWSSGSSCHEYAYTGDDVHRFEERYSARSLHQGKLTNTFQNTQNPTCFLLLRKIHILHVTFTHLFLVMSELTYFRH